MHDKQNYIAKTSFDHEGNVIVRKVRAKKAWARKGRPTTKRPRRAVRR
jgi:hypothetical protein